MEYIVEITNLNHQGEGIAKIDNKVVFIKYALPTEKVKIEITKEHKNFLEGKLIEIITPSKDRVAYECPYYLQCGGCQIANLDYKDQLLFKKEKVENILKKYSNIDIELEIIPSDKEISYRNKITYHVKNGKIGFYHEKTNDLIPIDNCLLVNDKVNNIIKKIKDNLDLSKVSKIMIRNTIDETMVVFYGYVEEIKTIKLLNNDANSIMFYTEKYNPLFGEKKIKENIGDLSFKISPDSFFQINTSQTEKMYKYILDHANLDKNKKVIDLYCGTGTIGLYLSRYCKEVLGIEINKVAVKDALENKKINNIKNISFECCEASLLEESADVIIVDPPRSGLDQRTRDLLLKLSPESIIYVSCDPMTLARDLACFQTLYDVRDITLFDVFPNTYHVECVCSLKLR